MQIKKRNLQQENEYFVFITSSSKIKISLEVVVTI